MIPKIGEVIITYTYFQDPNYEFWSSFSIQRNGIAIQNPSSLLHIGNFEANNNYKKVIYLQAKMYIVHIHNIIQHRQSTQDLRVAREGLIKCPNIICIFLEHIPLPFYEGHTN